MGQKSGAKLVGGGSAKRIHRPLNQIYSKAPKEAPAPTVGARQASGGPYRARRLSGVPRKTRALGRPYTLLLWGPKSPYSLLPLPLSLMGIKTKEAEKAAHTRRKTGRDQIDPWDAGRRRVLLGIREGNGFLPGDMPYGAVIFNLR